MIFFISYSLTLVDSLSTLAVMGRQKQFSDGVWWVAKNVHFNRNYSVSVFELTIRGLGGLLSAHALASDKRLGLVPEYNNELIPVAVDLADRLLKAFKTPTGLPVHKVHLQNGLESNESRKTCTACAGTLLMEFALLSHYTDDMKYHDAAWGAMMRLVNSTSPIHLAGSMIDVDTGEWTGQEFGIGSGVDSFLEYTLKASFFLSSDVLHQKFHQMYESLLHHSKASGFYFNIHMRTGRLSSRTVDSLSAFWPGLQVLMGDLHNAVQTFEAYFKLWRAYGFIPETFNVGQGSFGWGYGYPLRPELAESLYFLYQATGNSYYVDCAREMVASIETFAKTKCGYATIANVVDFRLEDRMDSYFFSETLKYLFLIFDDAVHRNGGARKPCGLDSLDIFTTIWSSKKRISSCKRPDMKDYIFTTEGHPIPVLSKLQRRSRKSSDRSQRPLNLDNLYEDPEGHKLIFARKKRRDNLFHSMVKRKCKAFRPFQYGQMVPYYNIQSHAQDHEGESTTQKVVSPVIAKPMEYTTIPKTMNLPSRVTIKLENTEFVVDGVTPDGLQARMLAYNRMLLTDGQGNRAQITLPPNLWKFRSLLIVRSRSTGISTSQYEAVHALFGRKVCTKEPAFRVLSWQSAFNPFQQSIQFDELFSEPIGFTASVVYANPEDGCSEIMNANSIRGKIGIVRRGACSFLDKATHVQNAGGVGMIVVNNVEGSALSIMSADHLAPSLQIPSLSISMADGESLRQVLETTQDIFVEMISLFPCSKQL
eukprot:TRINITY_DN6059_c0_g1_i3.p1 TRINITY_DN6059_c0_g1~~TRINITY_DN6059_c0_g1_i3.p1  ORF type:complete len:763 (+),score=110.05 TRINITY_DN6059_c0_g1_i3:1071-3359(+)